MSAPGSSELPDWQRKVALTGDVLINDFVIPAGNPTAIIPVAAFNSLLIEELAGGSAAAQNLQIIWCDTAGNLFIDDFITLYGSGSVTSLAGSQLPVRAPGMILVNNSPNPATIRVYGSARVVSGLTSVSYVDAWQCAIPNQAFANNTVYVMFPGTAGASQGEAWCDFTVTGAAVGGELQFLVSDQFQTNMQVNITDTALCHAMGGNQRWYGRVILPANPFQMQFVCRAAGTAAISAHFVSLGH